MEIRSVEKHILKYATAAAEKSTYNRRQKVGAVVFMGKKILSFGFNSEKTDPLQKKYNSFREDIDDSRPHKIHAEINALKKLKDANIDLSRASIVVCRLSNTGTQKYAMARPCPACFEYIKECGLKHIYYTTDQGFAEEILDY